MIVDAERIRLLKTNSLFKGVPESSIKPYLKPKFFSEVKEGEIIYVCGDVTTDLFLIVEGEVKIKFSCNGNGGVKHKYLSDFFGEEEILNGGERTSSAVANTDCILFKINSTELKHLSSSNKKIADNLKCKGKDVDDDTSKVAGDDLKKVELPKYQPPASSTEKTGNALPEDLDDDVDWTLEDT